MLILTFFYARTFSQKNIFFTRNEALAIIMYLIKALISIIGVISEWNLNIQRGKLWSFFNLKIKKVIMSIKKYFGI